MCVNVCEVQIINIGERYGQWTIIGFDAPRVDSTGKKHERVICRCDCGKVISKDSYKLKSGAKMCKECYLKIAHTNSIKFEKKPNTYEFIDDYVIGHFHNKDDTFIFDASDFDKVKRITWCIRGGYAYGRDTENNKIVFLHKYIMGDVEDGKVVDHIDRNPLNCRRSNLRVCTQAENTRNRSTCRTNKSGFPGVYFEKQSGKWLAHITCNGVQHYLGSYGNFEDAVNARITAEKQYFGEYAPIR